MGWNYRVMKHIDKVGEEEEIWYGIHEVYYRNDEVNDIKVNADQTGYTVDPIGIRGENIEDLEWMLKEMQECLKKPILEYKMDEEK